MLRIIVKSLLVFAVCVFGLSCSKEKISTKDNKVYVEKVKVSPPEASLLVTESCKLTATVFPGNATNKKVRWTSSTPSVATVDANGKVTAVAIGTATITATAVMVEGKTGNCVVSVVPTPVPTTGVSIDQTGDQRVKVGGSIRLTCSLKPSNTTYHGVTWSSSNKSVATVDENGRVTGVSRGTAVITVKTENGNHTASINVRVVQSFTSVKITSPSTSDDNYDASGKFFRYVEGESFQLQVKTTPAEADDSLIFSTGYDDYFTITPEGLVSPLKFSNSTFRVYATSAADNNVIDYISIKYAPLPKGITLQVDEIPGAEVVYKARERDSWDIGVGATHKYEVIIEPSGAPQDLVIKQSFPGNGKATFSLSGNILTVSVPEGTAPPAGPTAADKDSKVVLGAYGGLLQEFVFYTQKLDPYKAKEGDCLAIDHLDKVGIEDGGYRGNGRYDTKGKTVTTDFLIGSAADASRNFLVMWLGNDHLTDDPLWKDYGPGKKIMAGSKELHGIAVPMKSNKVYRSGFANGEIWQSEHTFIATNGDLPSRFSGNSDLLKNTSAKHSALFNTCAHVGANAGNGSSYEVRPAQFFVNADTKKPSTDKNVNCDDSKYWSLSDFKNNLPVFTSGMGSYVTPWLFPTLIDMCCVFVGEKFSSAEITAAQVAEANYRIALLKKRTGISNWNLTFWVSQEKDEDNATRFALRPDNTEKPVLFNYSSDSGSKTASALVYPIIYF